MSIPNLLTVSQFSIKYPQWSQGALRNLIWRGEDQPNTKVPSIANGVNIAIVRIGKKLLINEAKFFEWVQKQNK